MTTKARERPILFSGAMVKAILAGEKTQTRRVIKLRDPTATYACHDDDGWPMSADEYGDWSRDLCPHGNPGDLLWVRETFSLVPCSAGCEKYPSGFDPTVAPVRQPNAPHEGVRYRATWDKSHSARWRPSIHMPRWASRLTLRITDVRVERLQSIGEADVRAEGVTWNEGPFRAGHTHHVSAFRSLWNSINGKRPGYDWQSDPWVWALTFERIATS